MAAPRPPVPRRFEPADDPDLNRILLFARDRAAQRSGLGGAALGAALDDPRRSPGGPRSAPTPAPAASRAAQAGAPGELLARADVAPSVAVFRIGKPAGLRFEPGQAVKIGLGGVRRSYTIASAPDAPHLELCVERVPGGALTGKLFALPTGSRLEVGASAKGDLLFDPAARAHLMIATVTGIAPFMSMLRHVLPRAPATRIVLLHGTRHPAELAYRAELEQLAARHPGLSFWPAVTQPSAGWTDRTGRVTAHVDAALAALGAPGPLPRGGGGVTAYACGNPDMVREVSAVMGGRGIPIRTEQFWS